MFASFESKLLQPHDISHVNFPFVKKKFLLLSKETFNDFQLEIPEIEFWFRLLLTFRWIWSWLNQLAKLNMVLNSEINFYRKK